MAGYTHGVKYSEEIADKIIARMIDGAPLKAICREKGMPYFGTVHEWRQKHPEFAKRYADACKARLDGMMDEIEMIADDDSEDVRRSALRVDARKWLITTNRMAVAGAGSLTVEANGIRVEFVSPKPAE